MSLKPFKDFEARLRRFPIFVIHHRAMLVPDIRAQWMLRDFLIPFWIPLDDRVIGFLRFVTFKLDVESTVSLCIACEDHHAACDLIQTMHDEDFAISLFQHFDKVLRILLLPILQNGKPGGFICND